MTQSWTDDRLDDFRAETSRRFDEVDRRFDQVDKRFEQVDKRFEQVDKRFEQVDKRFERIDKRFEQIDKRFEQVHQDIKGLQGSLQSELNQRFEALNRTLLQLGGGIIVGLLGILATQL